jgi:cysteine/serine-rich nuclear protein
MPSVKSILKRQQSYHEQNFHRPPEKEKRHRKLSSTPKKKNVTGNCHRPQIKKNVTYDTVAVYYFPVEWSMTPDPLHGDFTRGMAPHHIDTQYFSVSEYESEQHLHPQDLLQSNSDRLDDQGDTVASSNYCQNEEQGNASEPELHLDSCSSLQQAPLLKRRYTRASGARTKQFVALDVCTDIQSPPSNVTVAAKNTRSCWLQAGTNCQQNGLNFPSGCSSNGSANSSGRIEFNSAIRDTSTCGARRLSKHKIQQDNTTNQSSRHYKLSG